MKRVMHPGIFRVVRAAGALRLATLGVLAWSVLALSGCGADDYAPAPPSLEWNRQKYGAEPAHRPLSAVAITTEAGWVVAREKFAEPAGVAVAEPAPCTTHLRIGGMDCGDCQRLVADELGMVAGIRQARISQPDGSAGGASIPSRQSLLAGKSQAANSQSEPEAVVEYDPGRVNPKQIEGTISSLGLLPEPIP
jgi:copper chaperone CopZ